MNTAEWTSAARRLAFVVLQVAVAGIITAYFISFFVIKYASTVWILVVSVVAYAVAFGIVEVSVIYVREVMSDGPRELGKQRAFRRRRLIKYVSVVMAFGGTLIGLHMFSIGGRPMIEYVFDYIVWDDTRYVRRALREVLDLSSDYSVKRAAVYAIAATKSPEAVHDLISIGASMEGRYESPGRFREIDFFCEVAEGMGKFQNQAAWAIVNEYKNRKEKKPEWTPRAPSLVQRISEHFKQLRTDVVEAVRDSNTSRPIEQELLSIEADLAKKLETVEQSYLELLKKQQPYKRSYVDLLLDALRNIKFANPDDQVYGMAGEIAFDIDFQPETRRRALVLFAEHGSLRDMPVLLNMAKNEKVVSLRVTATELLPVLGKKAFAANDASGSWMSPHRRARCE